MPRALLCVLAAALTAEAMVLNRPTGVRAPPDAAASFPPSVDAIVEVPEVGATDGAGPLYLSMSALVSRIKACLSREAAPYSEAMIGEVRCLLERTELNPREWEQFKQYESGRYTRNIVAVDETFVVLLLCWDRGQVSSVHDHAGSSCWVKLLSGDLEEQRYDQSAPNADGSWPTVGAPTAVRAGEATYMDDTLGVHHIANPSPETPAVSLHVYAPPFTTCGIYKEGGEVAEGSMVAAMAPHQREATCGGAVPTFARTLAAQEPISLTALCEALDGLDILEDEAASDAAVGALVDRLALTPEEWREYASGPCFSEFEYTRHLAFMSPKFSIVVCCWNGGQRGERYALGEKKSWTKVLHGALDFEFPDEGQRTRVDELSPLEEAPWMRAAIRQVTNADDDGVAVSLHVMSPPESTKLFESGVARDVVAHAAARADSHAAARVAGNNVFTNLRGLVRMLEAEFADGAPVAAKTEALTNLLQNVKLNEREWRAYADWGSDAFTRILLAENEAFNLVLVAWDRGNLSPVHDHDASASWTKVLEGSLLEATYAVSADEKLVLSRTGPMLPDTTTYSSPDLIHGCVSQNRCFTLTLYSPPYKAANAYADDGSGVTQVEIPTHVRLDGDRAAAPHLQRPDVRLAGTD